MRIIKWSLRAGVLLAALACAAPPCSAQATPAPPPTPTPQPTPAPTPAANSSLNRVKDWFCSTFGINPAVYDKLSRVRPGEADADAGMRLMRLDLRTEQEVELWVCNGCWSPARLGAADAVVLKRDGVWLVPPAPAAPSLAFPAENLIAIVGTLPQQADSLLVIIRTEDRDCRYALRVASLAASTPPSARRLQTPPDSPPACFDGPNDVVAIIKASRRRNDVVLSDTRRRGSSLTLSQLTKLLMLTDDPQPAPLTPRLNADTFGVGRFSPNWWNDTEVIYVAFQ